MPNDLRQRLDDACTDTLVETNAQTVSENLGNLRARFAVHRRRWIWELLQNAADATNLANGRNRVCIQVERGKLIFRHNGSAFSLKQITHLIYHGSTKQDDEGKGGKFGTGFLTIHLVSPKVRVVGTLEDEDTRRHFDFVLDRGGDTAAIRENMQEARARLERSLEPGRDEREFSTEFECELDSDAQSVVESGLVELERDIPYVLAAVPEFDEIKVERTGSVISWRRPDPQSATSETIAASASVVDIVRHDSAGNSELVRISIVGNCSDSVAVAVRLRQTDDRWELAVDDATPRLFYPFPLVDTHELALPFVILSKRFQPREERDGIRASADGKADERTQRNWELLGKVPALFKTLALFGADEGWLAAHRLAKIRHPSVGKWLDGQRFVADVLREILSFIRGEDAPLIVRTMDETRRAPRNVTSPARDAEGRIFALANRLKALRDSLPAPDITSEWATIGEGWESVSGKRLEELDEALTSDKLAMRIATCSKLEDLAKSLVNGRPDDALSWLNDLLASVPKDALAKFAGTHAVLPNQRDELRKEGALHLDGGIEEPIKDICEKLGVDVRPLLLHSGTTQPVRDLFVGKAGRTLSNDDCVERARKKLSELPIEAIDAKFVEGSAALLRWLIEKKRNEKLAGFPVFCAESRGELREKSPLLVPVALWEAGAREFASLFGPARRLHDGYAEVLQEEHWHCLAEHGFVLRSLFIRERIEGLDPRQVDGELKDDVEHAPAQGTTVSQIAFLKGDGGLLDQIRGSKVKGKQFIRLLLKYVVAAPDAEAAGCDVVCSCENGAHHLLLPAWLIQVKTREWVHLSRGNQDRPTAENLAPLLDDELTTEVQKPSNAAFISKLGIGVSELLRFRVPKEKRAQLDQIFGQMCASPDASTLASIQTVLDDPNIRAAVLEKKETRDKIRKNQRLGAAVERLLKQELESIGIRVTRTGRGSDFEVESDFLNESGQEQLIELSSEVGGYLLEVKSTTTEFVRMTLRQGEEAAKNRGRYALCVVDISGGEPDEKMVREHSRFVCGIGDLVESKVGDAKDLKDQEQKLHEGGGEVAIYIEGSSVRLQVGIAIWQSAEHGISFEEFIEHVRRRPSEQST